jgi:hypothetical protein
MIRLPITENLMIQLRAEREVQPRIVFLQSGHTAMALVQLSETGDRISREIEQISDRDGQGLVFAVSDRQMHVSVLHKPGASSTCRIDRQERVVRRGA